MVTKKRTAKKAPATTPPKKTELRATQFDGITKDMTQSQMQAALATRSIMTAFTIKAFSGCGDALDEADIMDELRKAGDEVVSGNMGRVEKMLTNQAIALDNIFNNMAQRSHNQQSFKDIHTDKTTRQQTRI